MLREQGIEVAPLAEAELAIADVGGGARVPAVAIPVLALADDSARPAELLGAGARAVLRRDCDSRRLCAALVAVHAGLVVVDAALARDAVPDLIAEADEPEELSSRERQVLTLIASGLSNRRIAERLEISEHTVKFHASSILAKLGVSTRTEAVVVAARRGLLWL